MTSGSRPTFFLIPRSIGQGLSLAEIRVQDSPLVLSSRMMDVHDLIASSLPDLAGEGQKCPRRSLASLPIPAPVAGSPFFLAVRPYPLETSLRNFSLKFLILGALRVEGTIFFPNGHRVYHLGAPSPSIFLIDWLSRAARALLNGVL